MPRPSGGHGVRSALSAVAVARAGAGDWPAEYLFARSTWMSRPAAGPQAASGRTAGGTTWISACTWWLGQTHRLGGPTWPDGDGRDPGSWAGRLCAAGRGDGLIVSSSVAHSGWCAKLMGPTSGRATGE